MKRTVKKRKGAFGAFLRDIGASCYDMARYREFRTMPLAYAFRYFLAFCLLVALAYALAVVPGAVGVLHDARNGVATALPEGASFAVAQGSFSTSLESPFEHRFPGFVLRVDTGVAGTSYDASDSKDTTVVIGEDAAFFIDRGDVQAYPFKDMEDAVFTKKDIIDWLQRNGALAVAAAAVAFGIGYLLSLFVGAGLFAAAASVVAMWLARLWRVRMPYRAWLSVGFHAVTLPVLADLLFDTFIAPLPFMFSVLYLMVLIAVAADERADPAMPVG